MPQRDVMQGVETTEYSGVISTQSNEKQARVKLVRKLYDQGAKDREKYDKNWDKYQRYEEGRQYDNTKKSSYKARVPFNIIRSTIQGMVPIMTDSKPKINILPQLPEDYLFSSHLTKYIDTWWDDNGMSLTMVDVITDSLILSAGIVKVIWDNDLQDGLGDSKVELIDPRDIYVNPGARDFSQEKGCKWVIQRSRRTVGELKRKFPKMAKQIRSDSYRDEDKEKQKTYSGDVTLQSPVDQKPTTETGFTRTSDEDVVEVMECWMYDETVKEIEITTADGEIKKAFKKNYPKGKLITILPRQNLELQCVENPYKDGEFPYARLVDTQKPRRFWGEGETEPLIEIQKAINKTANLIIDYMNFTGNPVWMVHKGSGVNTTRLTNQMGLVVPWLGDAHMKPSRDIPPHLPAYYFEFYQALIRFAETISGQQEISQGRRPQGITAAEALETLQEAAQTRMRQKERNLESFLQRLGKLLVSRTLQFVREPRMVKLTGAQGWPEFFQFTLEDVEGEKMPDGSPGEGKVQMTATPYNFNEDEQKYYPGKPQTTQPTQGMFDVRVLAGTALPFQKAQRGNVAFKLFDSQVIDEEELLETLEWPNKEETLKRVEHKRQQMAQMMPPEQGAQ